MFDQPLERNLRDQTWRIYSFLVSMAWGMVIYIYLTSDNKGLPKYRIDPLKLSKEYMTHAALFMLRNCTDVSMPADV